MYSTPMIYIYLRTLNKFEMNYYGNMLIVDKKMLSCVVFFTKRVTLLCLSSANNQHLPPVSLSLSLSQTYVKFFYVFRSLFGNALGNTVMTELETVL